MPFGYDCLQQVRQTILHPTDMMPDGDILGFLLSGAESNGIFLLDGVLEFDVRTGQLSPVRAFQLSNAFYQSSWVSNRQYLVLLDSYINMLPELQPLIPVLDKPLPARDEVRRIVAKAVDNRQLAGEGEDSQQETLVRACLGLPTGELRLVLNRYGALAPNGERLVQLLLQHKMEKLKGRGLEYISEPDVPDAAGLDLLNSEVDKLKALLDPTALKHNLSFPKGWCLWGPPGTGKSLSAKLIAGKLGIPLLASDWGALLGSAKPDVALRDLLEIVESLAPNVFYFDDFDKGFAGWDSDAGGGIIRRIAGKFLTWLQEHKYPVFMIATVNRLNNLPPELIRRFNEIFFVDMPNNGGIYEIFNLHLRKYFPQFRESRSPFNDDQWRILLRDYNLCTPAEIANAVKKAAQDIYYRNKLAGRENEELKVTLNDLRRQRALFTPAMVRDEDQIYAIRNNAPFARPAIGPDRSRFAPPPVELFS